jgi:trans-aconitate methyltransferase
VANTGFRRANGVRFDDADVARCYAYRPPYAPALFEFLLSLVFRRRRALDLGSGPGKIARALAPHFDTVVAIEPSRPMIEAGQKGAPSNIVWLCETAEGAELEPFDLATCGASLHWMDHRVLFPKLAAASGMVAVIDGDGPFEPPFHDALEAFLTRWLAALGRTYNPRAFVAELNAGRRWIALEGEKSFIHEYETSLADFIEGEHSRATWTRKALGPERSRAFDADLSRTLEPFAVDGLLRFRVKSRLAWGKPLTRPNREVIS